MQKNVASQKWNVFAFDLTSGSGIVGDSANITANIRIDGGASNPVDDTNPTELENGYYVFDISQAESNGDYILMIPESTTANVQVLGVPGSFTTTAANFNALNIVSNGALNQVDILSGHVIQTGDSFAIVNNGTYGNAQLVRATTPANTLDIASTGEAGLDFDNIKNATGSTTLTNIIVPNVTLTDTTTTNTDMRGTNSGSLAEDWTSARAGYIDNLNIGEDVAGTSEITALNDITSGDVQTACDAAITTNTTIVNIDIGVDATEAKLPTNYIMGSSDQTDKDDEIDNIDSNVTTIATDTGTTIPNQISALNDIASGEVTTATSLALSNIGLNKLISSAVTGTDVADDSIVAQLVDNAATADWDNYNNTVHSLKAILEQGNAAWTTGAGGSGSVSISDIINVQPLIPYGIDLADTATYRAGIMMINSVDNLPSIAEITPGTISIDRKAIGGTSWNSIVSDEACSEIAGLVYYDEVYDSGTGYAEGDSIQITFKNQKVTVSGNDYEIIGATGRSFYTSIRQTMATSITSGEVQTACDAAISANTTIVNIDTGVDATEAKLPTNYIMGSSNQTDKDDDIDSIVTSTGTTIPNQISALNDISSGEVNTEVDNALSDIQLDKLISSAVTGSDVADDSIIAQIVDSASTSDWDNYNNTQQSLKAIRTRGDAAWVTGGGGAISQIINLQPLIPNDIDLADTATYRLGMMLINSVDDLPSAAEISPGTISIDRKALGNSTWSNIVSGAVCSESAGLIYYDEVFDSSTGYVRGDSIQVTFKNQTITADANDYEISDSTGRVFYTNIRQQAGEGSSLTSQEVANAVWDEILSGHIISGSAAVIINAPQASF